MTNKDRQRIADQLQAQKELIEYAKSKRTEAFFKDGFCEETEKYHRLALEAICAYNGMAALANILGMQIHNIGE